MRDFATAEEVEEIRRSLRRLESAIRNGRSTKWCLRLWSRFIKLRDGNCCVTCGSTEGCMAHHIFRQTRLPAFRFLPGNGITLCREHHSYLHAEFNGPTLPHEKLNARGGEDPNEIAATFGFLADDAEARGLPADEFYYLSDAFLDHLKMLQGLPMDVRLSSRSRIRQAEAIFEATPPSWGQAIAEAALLELITGRPMMEALRELERQRRKENIH